MPKCSFDIKIVPTIIIFCRPRLPVIGLRTANITCGFSLIMLRETYAISISRSSGCIKSSKLISKQIKSTSVI